MSTIKAIRELLKLTQTDLGQAIGCSQGNVGFYERGQDLPVARAERLIEFAATKDLHLTLDQVYGREPLPEGGVNETDTEQKAGA